MFAFIYLALKVIICMAIYFWAMGGMPSWPKDEKKEESET